MKHSLFLLFGFFAFGCSNNETKKNLDTPTSGEISISVDETLRPILEAEVGVFESEYPRSKINATYKPEMEAIVDVLNDSSRVAIVSRKLSPDEKLIFKSIKVTPKEILIAHDALALIIHKSNLDSLMTMQELRMLLRGSITHWKQLQDGKLDQKVNIVVDHEASSSIRYLQDSILGNLPLSKSLYAMKTNQEVIDYVKNNPNALGVIGVNWISDVDDSTANAFLKDIRVIQIQNEIDKQYYAPFQAYIALKSYPLTRKVYAILREPRTGLGTGFSNFLASDKGQRVILKSGLVPATMPLRLIQTKKVDELF